MAKTPVETILVTGITGNQGGALARELLDDGYTVRGVTRDPSSDKAKAIRARGAEIVQGDFEKPDTIVDAARGVDVAYIMSTPFEEGTKAETRQGLNAVDAVTDAGVGHIIYSSVADADKETGIPHFESKVPVERRVKEGHIPWTIVGPVWYRENLLSPWWLPALKEGKLTMAMSGDRSLQNISVPEVGRFNAHVVRNHERFAGEQIDLASDATTPETMARLVGAAADVDIEFVRVPQSEARKENEDFARMQDWFERVGYDVDIDGLRRRYPDIGWQGFAAWVTDQDWTEVHQAVARTS